MLRAGRGRLGRDGEGWEPDRRVVASRAKLALAQFLKSGVNVRLVLDEIEPSVPAHHVLPSTQLQSRKAQQREQYRDDQEAEDYLRLLPARHLEVVVKRRHL